MRRRTEEAHEELGGGNTSGEKEETKEKEKTVGQSSFTSISMASIR
jgi:hypothetical protein